MGDGRPKILSVWIPLNDVDHTNGCMYMGMCKRCFGLAVNFSYCFTPVAKEFDNNFARDDLDSHLHLHRKAAVKQR